MDREDSANAAINGAIAAFISGAFTIVLVIYAIVSDADGTFSLWNDPFNFFDILLFFYLWIWIVANVESGSRNNIYIFYNF